MLSVLTELIESVILTIITPIYGRPGSLLRWLYYRLKLKKCGGFFSSGMGFVMKGCDKICIGKGCVFSNNSIIAASESIIIGDNVIVGPHSV